MILPVGSQTTFSVLDPNSPSEYCIQALENIYSLWTLNTFLPQHFCLDCSLCLECHMPHLVSAYQNLLAGSDLVLWSLYSELIIPLSAPRVQSFYLDLTSTSLCLITFISLCLIYLHVFQMHKPLEGKDHLCTLTVHRTITGTLNEHKKCLLHLIR